MNAYQELGYKNRREYLDDLADQHQIPKYVVYTLADLLGKDEDFDGLISALEDAESFM